MQKFFGKQLLATILIALLVAPIASAQPTPQSSVDVVTGSNATVSASGHFDVLRFGDRKVIRGSITSSAGPAQFTFDGKTIITGDGYQLVTERLTNDATEMVTKMTAIAPDGRTASAILRYNRQTNQGSETGFDRVRMLMSGSQEMRITGQALLDFRKNGGGPSPFSLLGDCADFMLLFAGACAGAATLCDTGIPILCIAGILAMGAAFDQMQSACPVNYPDGTIGWG